MTEVRYFPSGGLLGAPARASFMTVSAMIFPIKGGKVRVP